MFWHQNDGPQVHFCMPTIVKRLRMTIASLSAEVPGHNKKNYTHVFKGTLSRSGFILTDQEQQRCDEQCEENGRRTAGGSSSSSAAGHRVKAFTGERVYTDTRSIGYKMRNEKKKINMKPVTEIYIYIGEEERGRFI